VKPVPVDDNSTKEYADECKVEAPWWYRILGWPEGTTVLALILTLVAIAWG
jgi:hypothetical protein